MICAPLAARGDVLGVLKIASRHADGLGEYELALVRRFLPQVSVALQNSRRAESLHARTIEAEKRNALANLARGVAHDVNNALGSVVPLVQQIRDDARDGPVDPVVLARDLETIETSLQVCRRIFGGMLAFARGGARGTGDADLAKALDTAFALVEDGLARRGVARAVDLPDRLPALRARQTDLEQVFFNLFANARDAMPRGGTLAVRASVLDGSVEVVIRDDGTGIAEADLPRIGEPFFTTKPQGTGLGLSICRSLLWEMGGEMEIRSRSGEGTEVRVLLPAAATPDAARP
jgi:signal transduction histidine kinase